MEYKTVAEGRKMPGLRLVLSMGVPGPWGEAAKSIFYVKGISYVPVGQEVGADNLDLVDWTGVRNAPVAVYESEKPRDRWLDILMLAERLKPTPSLLPESSDDRAMVIGIANEICGEWGYGWCRRNMLLAPRGDRLAGEYDCTAETAAASSKRVADIQRSFTARLKAQKAKGSPYFVGNALTAADIYWAAFSEMLETPSAEINPMPDWLRAIYNTSSPEVDAAKDQILIDHRDLVYKRHLKIPMEF